MKLSSRGLSLAFLVTGLGAVVAYNQKGGMIEKYKVAHVSAALSAIFFVLLLLDYNNVLTKGGRKDKKCAPQPDNVPDQDQDYDMADQLVEPFVVSYPVPEPANAY